MQCRHIDLLPGESIRVGNKIVTLLEVEGGVAAFQIEDRGNDTSTDPLDMIDSELELVTA